MASSKHHPGVSQTLVVLILGLCTAACAVEFAGGTGEPNHPYLIATPQQLVALGSDPNLWAKHFALVRDLNMAGVDPNAMSPIGNCEGEPFIGVFDGRGHAIEGLRIVRKTMPWIGLFGQIGDGNLHPSDPNSGHVRNLHLKNAHILGWNVVGGLVGELASGTINNCSVTGTVTGEQSVGGLVGWAHGEIASCQVTADVQGDMNVGGLVGDMSAPVTRCRTSGRVRGRMCVGGLIGTWGCSVSLDGTWESTSPEVSEIERVVQCASDCSVEGTSEVGGLIACVVGAGAIEDCYARGPVSGSTKTGGLVGMLVGCCVVHCFSTGCIHGQENTGGFVGRNEPIENAEKLAQYPPCQFVVEEIQKTPNEGPVRERRWLHVYRPAIVSCLWDVEASKMPRGLGAGTDPQGGLNPLPTPKMRTAEAFRNFGWDFEKVWMVCEGKDYPRLRWEGVRCEE